jgi:hypothetical protein
MARQLDVLTRDRDAWQKASAQGTNQYRRYHSSAAASATYDRLFTQLCARSEEVHAASRA